MMITVTVVPTKKCVTTVTLVVTTILAETMTLGDDGDGAVTTTLMCHRCTVFAQHGEVPMLKKTIQRQQQQK
jgi:hypothetical protein